MKRLRLQMALWFGGLLVVLSVIFLGSAPMVTGSANLEVVSPADSGSGTLRQALLDAAPGDTITFSPSVFRPDNPVTIFVQSVLPTLNKDNVTIDASNAGVILDGSQAPTGTNGIIIEADNCVILGLTIQRFSSNGIFIAPGATGNTIGGEHSAGARPNRQGNLIVFNGANGIEIRGGDNLVSGNYIGVDGLGTWDWGNAFNGVAIWQGARGNIVGGTASSYRNVISGNDQNGVWIGGVSTEQNEVIGNYLGTRADGLGPVPNGFSGVAIQNGARNNRIGGMTNGAGNLISGNADNGIYISDSGTSVNQVLGNIIGPNWQGMGIIGQGLNGVVVALSASSNMIGSGTEAGRNLISGNTFDGVRIEGSNTINNTVQGNYIGSNINGTVTLPNGMHGVEITEGAHDNLVKSNLLSGNSNHGLVINGGAYHNTASGNLIGPDATGTYSLGNHPFGGIDIADGAHDNVIGGLGTGEGNLISGNQLDGIALFTTREYTGDFTADNQVLGNIIGLTLDGGSALPNIGPGIFNVWGAVRTQIEGNTISGNLTHGVQLSGETAMTSTLVANRIGTDITGTRSIPNGQYGVWISEGAHSHRLENNTISGNTLGGIMIRDWGGLAPYGNALQDNRIGTDITGTLPIGNGGPGVHLLDTARNNAIGPGNTIAFNKSSGVVVEACHSNTITQNSIYSNTLAGIQSDCLAVPQIISVTIGATETLTGTTVPNARVEFFSDDNDQGQVYEGFTLADDAGNFSFSKADMFTGPNLTATSTDTAGNTSGFSQPVHLLWTLLLYLNGDNDLEEFMFDTITNIVAAGPSPRANVLALVDGYTNTLAYSGTVLYDVTRGKAISLSAPSVTTGERNMGDGQTLADFVAWGRSYYPARHTMLAIVDHGGGWAPSTGVPISGPLPHRTDWQAGNSGLSWDFTSGYDYLESQEIRRAIAAITENGAHPLDVVFYDVCLMGMLEVAYQIKDYASFFVSSQNIGWAPLGPQGRYVQTILGIEPTTTPRQMAELLVEAYANATPPEQHPFTISAVDLASLPVVANVVDQLAVAITQTLTGPEQAVILQGVYSETQKLDYDSDFRIEPSTDGFVDLYDLAIHASQRFTDPAVVAAVHAVTTALDVAIVAEQHRSGSPWLTPDRMWDLDDVHGLSIFLPLGEDLELPVAITETSTITPGLVITRNLRLRDMYSSDQLQFVGDTAWKALIDTYYDVVCSPVITGTTEGPVDGVLVPDITPPQTTITVTGALTVGQVVSVTWVATDTQAGVASAALRHQPPLGQWIPVLTQTGSSGVFTFTLSSQCTNGFAVQAIDKAGNVEPLSHGSNMIHVYVQPCPLYLPLILRSD